MGVIGARISCALMAGRSWAASMDKVAAKIKYAHEPTDAARHRISVAENAAPAREPERGNHAVQARHARFRRPGGRPEARPSGGHERGVDRYAERPRRGA